MVPTITVDINTTALMADPAGIVFDNNGDLWVLDTSDLIVRFIAADHTNGNSPARETTLSATGDTSGTDFIQHTASRTAHRAIAKKLHRL